MNWRRYLPIQPAGPSWEAHICAFFDNLSGLLYVFADRVEPARIRPLHDYINGVRRRLLALILRLLAGTWRAPRPRAPRARPAQPDSIPPAAPRPRVRFPGRRGWLADAMAGQINPHSSCLAVLLEDPALRALLAPAEPQLARLLRPLAHMLNLRLPAVPRLPRRPRKPRPRKPTARERRAELWYPNIEGRPIDLYAASKKMG